MQLGMFWNGVDFDHMIPCRCLKQKILDVLVLHEVGHVLGADDFRGKSVGGGGVNGMHPKEPSLSMWFEQAQRDWMIMEQRKSDENR